jgi:hypothetical protein
MGEANMSRFMIANLPLQFRSVEGQAFGSQTRSETHVESSGGGGYLNQGSGYVSAPTVTSKVTTKREFWVRPTQGPQVSVQLTDGDMAVADGQRVTLVYGWPKGYETDKTELVMVLNHDSERHLIMSSSNLNTALAQSVRLWPIAVIVALIWAAAEYNSEWFGYGAAAFFVYRVVRRFLVVKKAAKRIEEHLGAVAQDMYRNRGGAATTLPELSPT